MSTETFKLRLWFIQETDKARLYSTTSKLGRDGHHVWLPRSQLEHVSKEPPEPGDWPIHVVTLPAWLAEIKGLA